MHEYPVKILEASYINYNVKRFIVEKPEGFTFVPGQATEVALDLPGWKDKLRPFTPTSLNRWPYLEFTIKIYDDHEGVTHQLGKTNAGAGLLLHDVFGTIQYKGPGIFIAAGAGVTPFIAILRDLYNKKELGSNSLLLTNKTSRDIINAEEFFQILGPRFINVFTREGVIGFNERRINKDFLVEIIRDFSQNFYVCGPDRFVQEITGYLLSLGATSDSLIVEQ